RRAGRDAYGARPARGLDGDARAQGGLPRRQGQVDVYVAPAHPIARVRGDPHHQVEVAGGRVAASPPALPGQADSLAVGDSRWDVHLVVARSRWPGQSDGAPATPVSILDRQGQRGLLVRAGNWPTRAARAEHPPEQLLEIDAGILELPLAAVGATTATGTGAAESAAP